jgi:succinyl-CoA synthetase alpha subunit
MSTLVDRNTRLLVQGITATKGTFHTRQAVRLRHAGRRGA